MTDRTPTGQFWDDLRENLKDPEFRRDYMAFSQEIAARDAEANTPTGALRERLADALHQADALAQLARQDDRERFADAVLPVVEDETEKLRRQVMGYRAIKDRYLRERNAAHDELIEAENLIELLCNDREAGQRVAKAALTEQRQRAEAAEVALTEEQQRADDRRTELLEERDQALHDLEEAERQRDAALAAVQRVRRDLDGLCEFLAGWTDEHNANVTEHEIKSMRFAAKEMRRILAALDQPADSPAKETP